MKKIVPSNAILIPDSAERVFAGKIFDVYQWQQDMFDGTTKTFEMLKRPDTVEIIAIKDGKMVVLEEEQPGLPAHYTLPAGRCDVGGESPLESARRELLEETGLTFGNWKLLKVVQPVAKCEWFIYTFLATNLVSEVAHSPESDGEKISIMYKTLDEVRKMYDDPKTRYLPKELLNEISTLDDILSLKEFTGKAVDR